TPELNQADGIHPTTEGYRRIVDNLSEYVIEAIKMLRATRK
ncbi:MAG: arylesterase, partial [Desulfobacterales bacterium]|nr:arylesterase [Desulfobacterales bacterium]